MSNSAFLLDTSAILTLLEDENGAGRVEMLLREEETLLPFMVLLETYYITLQEQPEDVAEWRFALLKQLPVTFLWNMDEPTLLIAGRLKARFRISLADAINAAFAIVHDAILVHKDPEFEALSQIVHQESLPFKT